LDSKQLREELLPLVTSYTATVHFGSPDAPVAVYADAQNKPVRPRVLRVQQGDSAFQEPFDIRHAGAPA
jgi:hypothetical protein